MSQELEDQVLLYQELLVLLVDVLLEGLTVAKIQGETVTLAL
jgi:hypothetical protein